MVENRKLSFKVGLFVTGGIVLFAAFVLILGGKRGFFKRYYKLYVVLEEAQGLADGSAISVGGIQGGNVAGIEFNPKGPGMLVTMKMEREVQNRITEGSTIALRTQGALGDKFLYINPGTYGGKPLDEGHIVEVETGGDLLTTLSKSGGKFEKAFQVIDNLNNILANINKSGLIDRLAATAGNLKSTSGNLDAVMRSIAGPEPNQSKVKKSLDHLSSILEKIDKGLARFVFVLYPMRAKIM
jgi:phospholipid/cholesterol/gamma-HCH transport system substrate-binding protein